VEVGFTLAEIESSYNLVLTIDKKLKDIKLL
jgi:hypothetical protein